MTRCTFPVPDIDKAVVRPIVLEVCRLIQNQFNLGNDCSLVYAGDTLAIPQSGSSINSRSDLPLFANKEKLYVDFKEIPRKESLRSTCIDERDRSEVLSDETLGWSVRPIVGDMECELSLRYRSKDNNQVKQWRDNFYTRLCSGVTTLNTDLKYSYPVSEHVLALIKQFWLLREKEESLKEYLLSCTKTNHHIGTNLSGTFQTLLFDVLLKNVTVLLTTTEVPEVERVKDGDGATTYTSSFTLRFIYSRPISYRIQYPLVINNQLLDDKYFDSTLDRNEGRVYCIEGSHFLNTLESWNSIKEDSLYTDQCYVLPQFDDWFVQRPRHHYKMAGQSLFTVDVDNPNYVLNLKELEGLGLYLNPLVYEYISDKEGDVFNRLFSAFGIVVYNRQEPMNTSQFYMDSDYTVWSKEPLDTNGHYHLQFGINKELRELPDMEMERLAKHGQFTLDCIRFLDPDASKRNPPKLNHDGTLNKYELIRFLTGVGIKRRTFGKQSIGFTVNTIAIMVQRRNNDD